MSLEETTRDIIQAWLDGFTWSTVPTVVVRPHDPTPAVQPATEEDDCTPRLPVIELKMSPSMSIPYNSPVAREDSPTDQLVYDIGRAEASSQFMISCDSKAQAEAFRGEWRTNLWLDMLADGQTKMPIVKKLDGFFLAVGLGVTDHIRVMLEPENFIYQPDTEDTIGEDLWVLRHDCLISYPILILEPPPGSGRMCVVINHQRCE
jgi:hypothetical protein